MPELLSLKDARIAGNKYYFTGKPCSRGHIDRRTVSGRACIQCLKENADSWYKSNTDRKKISNKLSRLKDLEHHRNKNKEWRDKNKEYVNSKHKQNYEKNKERITERHKEYYKKNKDKMLAYGKMWAEENKEKVRAAARKSNTRRNRVQNDYHQIMTSVESAELSIIYEEAALLGPNWHVDHIVPLSRGGEHRPYNVQIVRSSYNVRKNAKLWYTPADLGKHLPAHYAEAAM